MFESYLQPAIQIGNLRVEEPITTATDMLLAGICIYAFMKIRRKGTRDRLKWYLKYFFLVLGLSALLGGFLGHAFLYRLAPGWKLVSWLLVIFSVGLMVHATIEMARPLIRNGIPRILGRMNLLILAVAVFFTIWGLAFPPVTYYTLFGMVAVVGSLSYYIYTRTKERGPAWFLLGVAIGAVSALIYGNEWGLSPWFNHADISHVILSASALVLYKGATLVLDNVESIV